MEKRGKGGIFTVLWGKMSFWKNEEGAKILYLRKYIQYTPL